MAMQLDQKALRSKTVLMAGHLRAFLCFAALACVALALAGCVSLPKGQPVTATTPVFDPIAFFSGRTEGRGTLQKLFSSPVSVTVRSQGTVDEAGIFIIDQEILEGEKPPRSRSWRIAQLGDNRYSGSLSDAQGPVTISVDGNQMQISFVMKGGFPVDQKIVLAADGQSARNVMVIKKLGLRVAVLDENIVKLP